MYKTIMSTYSQSLVYFTAIISNTCFCRLKWWGKITCHIMERITCHSWHTDFSEEDFHWMMKMLVLMIPGAHYWTADESKTGDAGDELPYSAIKPGIFVDSSAFAFEAFYVHVFEHIHFFLARKHAYQPFCASAIY